MNDEATPAFADGKAPEALRTIGEVAKALGIRQHVLRYWEEQFPMLKPLKRSGGRRYYRAEDVRLIETIDRLVHREGYTLKGAKKALQGGLGRTPASCSVCCAVWKTHSHVWPDDGDAGISRPGRHRYAQRI